MRTRSVSGGSPAFERLRLIALVEKTRTMSSWPSFPAGHPCPQHATSMPAPRSRSIVAPRRAVRLADEGHAVAQRPSTRR